MAVEIKDFEDGMNRYQQLVQEATRQAVYEFAAFVLTKAKEICPIKTGFLVDSGELSEILVKNGAVSITIGFNANYAAAVHEILTKHHASPTQAKFLEKALNDNIQKLPEFVKKRIDQVKL